MILQILELVIIWQVWFLYDSNWKKNCPVHVQQATYVVLVHDCEDVFQNVTVTAEEALNCEKVTRQQQTVV
jgi:hypothetical protein